MVCPRAEIARRDCSETERDAGRPAATQVEWQWVESELREGGAQAGGILGPLDILDDREDLPAFEGLHSTAPREKPLNEVAFENLRIVPDALWFAAQTLLSKNTCIRGRKSKKRGR